MNAELPRQAKEGPDKAILNRNSEEESKEETSLRNFRVMTDDLQFNDRDIDELIDYIILNAGRLVRLYYDNGVVTVIPEPMLVSVPFPPLPPPLSSPASPSSPDSATRYPSSSPPPASYPSYPLFNDEVTEKLTELVDHMYQEILGWRKEKFIKTDTTTAATADEKDTNS